MSNNVKITTEQIKELRHYIIVVNVSEMTEDILNMIPSRYGSFGVFVKSVGNIKAL